MMYFEGVEYSGFWKEDVREGMGSMFYKDSWFFEGVFHSDTTDGPGVLVYKTLDPSPSTTLKFTNKKAFHPLIPYLSLLQDFHHFLKSTLYITDVFIFSTQSPAPGIFRAGKLNG